MCGRFIVPTSVLLRLADDTSIPAESRQAMLDSVAIEQAWRGLRNAHTDATQAVLGIWTACGLIIAWFGCFTLFPALQSLLRTPLRSERSKAGTSFPLFVDFLISRKKMRV